MIKRLLFLSLMLALVTAIQIGCGSDSDEGTDPVVVPPPRLVVDVQDDPGVGDIFNAAVWDSIDTVSVPIGSENEYNANLLYVDNKTVEMQAFVAGDSVLYVRVDWDDNDQDDRFGQMRASWTINDKIEWAVSYPDDTSETAFNEDRFYMIFDQGGPNGANCAAFCHDVMSADERYFYGEAGDDADVWHWKAHRTGLANLADDMHLTTTRIESDPQASPTDFLYAANHGFKIYPNAPGDSSYFLVTPKYMHEDGADYTGAGLLESEITDISGWFTTYDNSEPWITFLPPPSPPVGKSLPGYYITDESGADGSRWDIEAYSRHSGGRWTVIFRRALTTADADDISFDFATPDSVEITIGITDNSGIAHFGRRPFYMVFP